MLRVVSSCTFSHSLHRTETISAGDADGSFGAKPEAADWKHALPVSADSGRPSDSDLRAGFDPLQPLVLSCTAGS